MTINDAETYLVEIWQNHNGCKLVWYEVMVRCGDEWCLYSDPCKKLSFNQVAYRWLKISDISSMFVNE